jgi:hypothetical protein
MTPFLGAIAAAAAAAVVVGGGVVGLLVSTKRN